MSTYTIYPTLEKAKAASTACSTPHTLIIAELRAEKRHYGVTLPAVAMPNTDDVPANYRPIVDAALQLAAKGLLASYLGDKTKTRDFIPCEALSSDRILNAASEKAMSAGMTPERLLALWKATSKHASVAVKLAKQTGPALKAYQAAVSRHEERVKTLASKASKSLSDSDLDKLLTNMDDDDYTSPYGFYVVAKIEALRADRGNDDEDIDSL